MAKGAAKRGVRLLKKDSHHLRGGRLSFATISNTIKTIMKIITVAESMADTSFPP